MGLHNIRAKYHKFQKNSDVLFVSYKYNYAHLERKANGACKPEGLLYQCEPNVVKRWQNETLHVAMLIITYIILYTWYV